MARKHSHTSRTVEPPEADDLKLINGIGPGVENRLHGVGIFTFAQLAALSPADIAASVSGLAGLTAERIAKQDWIGQARMLASRSKLTESEEDMEVSIEPRQQVTFAAEVKEDVQVLSPLQHIATFTIELLLSEDNETLQSELVHIQSRSKESWDGWQAARLLDFMVQQAGIKLPPVESAPTVANVAESIKGTGEASAIAPLVAEELETVSPVIEEEIVSTSPPTATTESATVLRLREMEILLAGTDNPRSILRSDQPFEVRLTLDVSDVLAPDETPLNYRATVYGKRLGSRMRQTVGEAQGIILPTDNVTLNVKSIPLPPGTYRLEADVNLTTMESPQCPDLKALLRGNLLQVY